MKVEMRDGLSPIVSRVGHQSISTLLHAELPRDGAGGDEEAPREGFVSGPQLGHGGKVPARDEQDVDGSLLVQVMEGDELRLLVDDPGRDPTGRNLTEDTARRRRSTGHVGSLRRMRWLKQEPRDSEEVESPAKELQPTSAHVPMGRPHPEA